MIDAPAPTRPSVEERRQQIQDAAAACFRRSGFHGASMAEIAKAANLSVGQIYRYFENKEAIIEAIVEQDLAEKREKFAEFYETPGDMAAYMVENCAGAIGKFWDRERAALMLEVLAEAARNPKVAAILHHRDEQEHELTELFRQRIRRQGWSEEETELRAELIGMMFDGMASRSINSSIDPARLEPVLRKVMNAILEVETPPHSGCCGGKG
jgi:AcrR family transcriptional regulator